jgi:transcriptional regulator with XRE-family HTH domain
MTAEELVALRKSLGLTQTEMAELMGMKTRAFQEIENGRSPVREIHRLAAERGALHLAAERGEPMLAPASARRDALKIAQLMLGEQ